MCKIQFLLPNLVAFISQKEKNVINLSTDKYVRITFVESRLLTFAHKANAF